MGFSGWVKTMMEKNHEKVARPRRMVMATAHQKMPPSVRSTVAAAPRDQEPLGACMNSTRGGRMGLGRGQAGATQASPSGTGGAAAGSPGD
jgi:hypothetical protein